MLRRLHALYLRYAAVHEDRLRGVALGPVRRRAGQVEQVVRRDDRIEITGWANADTIRVTWPGGEVVTTPQIYRGDVAAQAGLGPDCGFEVAVPADAQPLTLGAEGAHGGYSVALSHPSDAAPASAHRRLKRAFLRDLGHAAPTLMRYLWRPTAQAKTAVKRALG